MLLDAAALALLVGLLVGRGRLGRLRDLELRAPWLFLLAAAVKVALLVMAARAVAVGPTLARAAHLSSYLLVMVGLLLNCARWDLRLIALGVALNFVVIAANGGSMPVDRALAERAGNLGLVKLLDSPHYVGHVAASERTRLRPLADILPLPLLIPRPRFFSPGSVGDVLITVGACWLLLSATGSFGLSSARASGDGGQRQGGG